jgi:hypothetical protein
VKKSRLNSTLFGAVGGGALALVVFLIAIGRFGLETVVQVDGDPVLSITTGSLYLLVLIVSALAGLLIGAIGYGIGVSADPDAPRFGIRYLLPVSAGTTAVVAYAVLRIGIGAFGDIEGGVVTVGALRTALIVLVMGLAAGAVTSGIADALARPELFAFGGEAWPSSTREVMRAMLDAVSAPLVAAVVAALAAIPLSLVLIELEGDAATILFSVVGALVLGGTTLVAARPWDPKA